MFAKTKKCLLDIEFDESKRKDNVTTRDEFRVQYEKIVTRVEKAYQSELAKIKDVHDEIEDVLGVTVLKSNEVLDFVEKAKDYYDEVNKAQLFASYDSNLISQVKSKRAEISKALEDIDRIVNEQDRIEALILMSHDPLKAIRYFRTLANKIVKDMESVNDQIKKKSSGFEGDSGQQTDAPYEEEKKIVEECIKLYEGLVSE